MKKILIITGIILGACCLLILLLVGGYALYLQLSYNRIPDYINLSTENNPENILEPETTYTAVTYNIGFGAYEPTYTCLLYTSQGTLKMPCSPYFFP